MAGGLSTTHKRWTPEERSVVLATWKEFMEPSGKARDGLLERLRQLLPHRSLHEIKRCKNRLVKTGQFPKFTQRRTYIPLQLTPAEAAWLCAIFEGEGSVHDVEERRKAHYRVQRGIQISACINSDLGVIRKTQLLLPSSRLGRKPKCVDSRGIVTNRDVYTVRLSGFLPMTDYLRVILPYMAHEEKKQKCLRILEYLEARLGAGA